MTRAWLFAALLVMLSTQGYADERRLGRILAAKQLRVCVWPDYYGISFRNPKTQTLSGIDIDMAEALASDLGVAVRFIDSSFARLIEDLTGDKCEVAIFAIGINPQRLEKLRFTRPHLASDIYAMTTRSNRRIQSWNDIDQPGSLVVVAKGTLHEPVMRQKLKAAELLVVETPHAREQEVQSGRADADKLRAVQRGFQVCTGQRFGMRYDIRVAALLQHVHSGRVYAFQQYRF